MILSTFADGLPRRVLGLICVPLIGLAAGCATPGIGRPHPVSGTVGVAIVAQPRGADVSGPGTYALQGAAATVGVGLVAVAAMPFTGGLSVFWVFRAPPVAAKGAERVSCASKLDEADPRAAERLAEAIGREFSAADLREAFVAALRERTTAAVVPLEAPSSAQQDWSGQLLSAAETQHVQNVLALEPKRVALALSPGATCAYDVSLEIEAHLYQRRPNGQTDLFEYRGSPAALASVDLPQLEQLVAEPGRLRARLGETYQNTASHMVSGWPLEFVRVLATQPAAADAAARPGPHKPAVVVPEVPLSRAIDLAATAKRQHGYQVTIAGRSLLASKRVESDGASGITEEHVWYAFEPYSSGVRIIALQVFLVTKRADGEEFRTDVSERYAAESQKDLYALRATLLRERSAPSPAPPRSEASGSDSR